MVLDGCHKQIASLSARLKATEPLQLWRRWKPHSHIPPWADSLWPGGENHDSEVDKIFLPCDLRLDLKVREKEKERERTSRKVWRMTWRRLDDPHRRVKPRNNVHREINGCRNSGKFPLPAVWERWSRLEAMKGCASDRKLNLLRRTTGSQHIILAWSKISVSNN